MEYTSYNCKPFKFETTWILYNFTLLFPLLRCSLHVAMQYNSLEVVKVLLKYGVDPNEPLGLSGQTKSRRSSYQSSCGTDGSSPVTGPGLPYSLTSQPPCDQQDRHLTPSPTLVIHGPDSPSLTTLDQRLGLKTPEEIRRVAESGRVQCSGDLSQHGVSLPPGSPASTARPSSKTHQNHCGHNHLHHPQHPQQQQHNQHHQQQQHNQHQQQQQHNQHQQQHNQWPSPSLAPSSHPIRQTGNVTGPRSRNLEPPGRSPGMRRANSPVCHLPEIVETVIEDGFQYAIHYTREELFNLPCLFLAVVEGNSYFVHLLLRYGAKPNIQDLCGCSPLHLACCPDFHNVDIIRILLRYGAKIYLNNAQADSPFTLWPEILHEQKEVVRAALTRVCSLKPAAKSRSRTPSGPCPHSKDSPPTLTPVQDSTVASSHRSGSVSRFFKRLSSEPKPRMSREKRSLAREESSVFYSDAGRDRTYSTGSCKSLRSRHLSSYVQEDLDSDMSLVSPA